ncbi:hypothetical protein JTB14_036636 [Gonioctena quinquepunctata]|nr:hypothetical protein JTB14_036636 [Gonioctena quinquepunctata]
MFPFAFLLIFWVGFGVEAVEDSFCSATDTAPVYIPHEEDCSKYWQCSNGKAYLQNCPNDTHFNSILNICLQSGIECPAVDGEELVYGALPDCTTFCQCSNGAPHLHYCADATHFNPVLNVCDYPENAGCFGENGNNSNGGNDDDESNDSNGDERNESDTGERGNATTGIQICLESGIECPAVEGEKPVNGALPDCTKFCQCSNGKPYLLQCADTTHFNPVLGVCDYPENVGCIGENENNTYDGNESNESNNGNGTGSTNDGAGNTANGTQICLQSGIECPAVDGEQLVYGALPDCTKFCQCSNGKPYMYNCADTTHFNPALNVCDYPENAHCIGSV